MCDDHSKPTLTYRVLIVVNDKWLSDGNLFQSFAAARRHQTDVARRCWKYETAIASPDHNVLNFMESAYFRAEMENES